MKKTRHDYTHETVAPDKSKAVIRKYKVSPQTAYHITRIAMQENMTEGRVIDKIMRTYLATQSHHRQ